MDLSKYLSNAPEDLGVATAVPEYQLLKVYAYNAYFNADPIKIEDVNNGCTYCGGPKRTIDGVYINESLEENTVECVYSYFVGNSIFVLNDIYLILSKIAAEIGDVNKHHFVGNKEADTPIFSI